MTLEPKEYGSDPAGARPSGKRMRRIVVSLLKGGVAKSETAVSLAFGLAARGRRVLLVDTDVQAHCSDMLGVEPERGLADLIAGWGAPERILVEARENLWLLAGGNELAALKMEIARREMASEAVLSEALEVFEGQFDYLIMDTAPGWDTLLVNALYASNSVLSPVSMEPMALSGLVRFEERLQVIQKYKPDLRLRWVVPTFVDGRVKKSAEILNQLREKYGYLVGPPIKYSVKASEAPAYGRTVFEHDPKGTAAQGYDQLTERILQDCERDAEHRARGFLKKTLALNPAPPPPGAEPAARPAVVPEPLPRLVAGQVREAGEVLPGQAGSPAREAPQPNREGFPTAPGPAPAARTEPPEETRLSRQGLIEKILEVKESASPRSKAKFSWIIERLENTGRKWTQTDLSSLDQIIDKMIRSDEPPAGQGPKPLPEKGPLPAGPGRRASGPLTARLQRKKESDNGSEDLIQAQTAGLHPGDARAAEG